MNVRASLALVLLTLTSGAQTKPVSLDPQPAIRPEEWGSRPELEQLSVAAGPEGSIRSVSLTPDGRWLAAGSVSGGVRVWALEAGGDPRVLCGSEGEVTSVSLTHDGRWLAAGYSDRTVLVWNLAAGHSRVLHGPQGEFRPMFPLHKGQNLWLNQSNHLGDSSVSLTPDGVLSHCDLERVLDVASDTGERISNVLSATWSIASAAVSSSVDNAVLYVAAGTGAEDAALSFAQIQKRLEDHWATPPSTEALRESLERLTLAWALQLESGHYRFPVPVLRDLVLRETGGEWQKALGGLRPRDIEA